LDLWELTLESLLDTLETSFTQTQTIRLKLETISRDIVVLKATIEGMVATAQTNVNARIAQLQREYDDAKANADKHRGCFRDVGESLKTIFSLGISCAMLDSTLKKAEKAARDIDRTKENFENNVAPLVDRLKGLNGVAEDLLKEAMGKTTMVREFEEELKRQIAAFKQKQGKTIAIRMSMMRTKMLKDLADLIVQCDKTIAASAKRENDFKSILVEADKKMAETSL
jgi:cell division septum initiation protein DivIVA